MAKFDKSRIPVSFDYVQRVLREIGVANQTRQTKNGWPYLTFRHPKDDTPVSFQVRAKTRKQEARIVIFMPGEIPGRQKVRNFFKMSEFFRFIGMSDDKIEELRERLETKGTKKMDHNGWHYNGDVGIRHGGYYWHQDSNDSDIFHVVRVVPASDWGGPDNQFQIEDGIVDLGAMSDKIQVARETCGYPSDGTDRTLDFEAILTVYGLDVDSSQLVQIGPEDEFWNGRGKPQEPRLTLPEDTSLREWIKSVYLLPEDGPTLKL